MFEYITALLSFFFSEENQLITMFISAFLSATVLPGNSELVFTTLASQHLLVSKEISSLCVLIVIATLGNSLGSLVTYAMGWLVPKPLNLTHRTARWALEKSEKYGVFILLLSSLPILGDLLCAAAGWLRFNVWLSALFITLGKLLRYLFLVVSILPFL